MSPDEAAKWVGVGFCALFGLVFVGLFGALVVDAWLTITQDYRIKRSQLKAENIREKGRKVSLWLGKWP